MAARFAAALLVVTLAACAGTDSREDQPAVDVAAARRDGEAAYAAGDWRGAEAHYRTLVRAIPQDAELWFRLANIYARTEQPDLAVQAYREALVRDGDLGKAWFNMGVVHLREAANSFMKMQVHVAPDDAMARQGAEAYAAVMAILGSQDGGGSDSARPAAAAPVPAQTVPLAADPPASMASPLPAEAVDAVASPAAQRDPTDAQPVADAGATAPLAAGKREAAADAAGAAGPQESDDAP